MSIDSELYAKLDAATSAPVYPTIPGDDPDPPVVIYTQASCEPDKDLALRISYRTYAYQIDIFADTQQQAIQIGEDVISALHGWTSARVMSAEWDGQSMTADLREGDSGRVVYHLTQDFTVRYNEE